MFEHVTEVIRADVDRICGEYDPASKPQVLCHRESFAPDVWASALDEARLSMRSEVEAAAAARYLTGLTVFGDEEERGRFRTRLFGALSKASRGSGLPLPTLAPEGRALFAALTECEVAAVAFTLEDDRLASEAASMQRGRLRVV